MNIHILFVLWSNHNDIGFMLFHFIFGVCWWGLFLAKAMSYGLVLWLLGGWLVYRVVL